MVTIRQATRSDVERIYQLITAIADHHGQTEFVLTNPKELAAAGFGESSKFGVLLAELESSVVGYLSYTINYSIWLGRSYMNIDDVYVDAQFRSSGVGDALMQQAKEHCLDKEISRIRWEVEMDNHRAISFYEKLGARYRNKGVFSWGVSR